MNTPTDSRIIEGLLNEGIDKSAYGQSGKYQDHLFEQYKLYAEMADRISARRVLANTFFLTLHTTIIGAIGFSNEKMAQVPNKWVIIFPLLALILLCVTWWMIVNSYRQLNTAKYKVVGEFERYLPASPYWSAEWKALGEGKDPKKYLPLTHVETWVPVIFGVVYLVLGWIYFSM
jgi:hypothetical protein